MYTGKDIVSGQLALVEAAKKAGTIKRFYPSEYGGDFVLTGKEGSTFNPHLRKFLEAKEVCLLHTFSQCFIYIFTTFTVDDMSSMATQSLLKNFKRKQLLQKLDALRALSGP